VSGNSANRGGGIYSSTAVSVGRTTITNSTISGNSATGGGGGVYNADGLSVIEYSTITDNTAPSGEGSGVASVGDPSTSTQVISSIISANTNTDVDVVVGSTNSFDSDGYNLVGDGDATAAFNQSGDHIDVADPKLKELGNYGGPTQTHAPKPGSLAINAIPNATNGCGTDFSSDQRAVLRPQGGKCEIGSFEDRSPRVNRVVPKEEATGVAPAINVRAFISHGVSRPSINSTTFKLYRAGSTSALGAEVSFDAHRSEATLNPDDPLERGRRYRAVITTGVRDQVGNRLDQDQDPSNGFQQKVWVFTVRSN
jgi:predicted outer membrane repeat protein